MPEKVELSDAATVLILASRLMPRTNSQFGSVWEFPHVELLLNVYLQYALCLSGLLVSHLVQARMLPPTSLPALCHVVAMGKACCTTFCKQLLNVSVQTKHLALPVGRVQDSYRFCRNLC